MRRLDTFLVIAALLTLIGMGAGMAATVPLTIPPRPSFAALPTPAPPSVFTEGSVGPVETLDPLFATTPAERSISALLFRGLVRLGADGRVAPDLAASWTIDGGGSSYTFHLRTDVRWDDGQPFTADDVVATFAILTDPAYDGRGAGSWGGITVSQLDRFTVVFRLAVPLGGFLSAMTQPLVPAHLLGGESVAAVRTDPFDRHPVGDGLFAFVGMTSVDVTLQRVGPPMGGVESTYAPGPLAPVPEPTSHAAAAPRSWFDRYRFLLFPDAASEAQAFEAQRVDAVAGLSPSDAQRLAGEPDTTALHYPGSSVVTLVPNLRFASGVMRDPTVRRALSSAIDRDAITDQVFGGAAVGVRTPIAPASFVFDQQASAAPFFDPQSAEIGLREAGWTQSADGWRMPGATDPVHIELLTSDAATDALAAAIAQIVAGDWQAIGLSVSVTALPPADLVNDRLRPGLFDVVLLDIDLGLDPDLYPLLFSGEAVVGGTNISGFQSSVMDTLLSQARLEADDATRFDRFRALQADLGREMPIVPLVFPDQVFVVRSGLSGPATRQVAQPEDRYWDVLAWRFASRPND